MRNRADRCGFPLSMTLADGVVVLDMDMGIMGRDRIIHPVVLRDADGVTLVDTGAPGKADAFGEALGALGCGLGDVRRILLTHQDMDHIGSARELARRCPGAQVLAHAEAVPYIQGERPLIKLSPERIQGWLSGMPASEREAASAILSEGPVVRVDHALADGERLPICGGVRVVHTPGHTPGHVSLLLERHGILIAADAMRVEDGLLLGPNPLNTPDMETAMRSVQKLAALPIETVVCYHGGVYGPGAGARIQQIAQG